MNNKVLAGAALGLVALGVAIGWLGARQSELRAREQLNRILQTGVREPAIELLQRNIALTRELQQPGYAEPGSGILQSYLIRIRRAGLVQGAPMKQRIDALVDNNTALLALLSVAAIDTRDAALRAAVEQFRVYAVGLRDRWESVPEIFMTGGNLPSSDPTLPAGLLSLLSAPPS